MAGIVERTVPVTVRFVDSDRVIEKPRHTFRGGVADPELGGRLGLLVWPAAPDEHGIDNPSIGGATLEGALQLELTGTAEGYRELARYLLGLAELDTTADPDFHDHHELRSADGRTRLHVIVRKSSVGPAAV